MTDTSSLGDRMKIHENAFRFHLPHRMPVIIRVDGRAFHTLTRGLDRPFDKRFMQCMDITAVSLMNEIQNAVFAYVQSDEISILCNNYKTLVTQPWFGNNLQKIVSVAAGIASRIFTCEAMAEINKVGEFDARAFVLPKEEVTNYFVWRQQDATRNSIQSTAQAHFSAKQLNCKNQIQMQDMLHEKGINWNDLPIGQKRGRCILRYTVINDNDEKRPGIDDCPPVFTQDRDYIEQFLLAEEEL